LKTVNHTDIAGFRCSMCCNVFTRVVCGVLMVFSLHRKRFKQWNNNTTKNQTPNLYPNNNAPIYNNWQTCVLHLPLHTIKLHINVTTTKTKTYSSFCPRELATVLMMRTKTTSQTLIFLSPNWTIAYWTSGEKR